MPATLLDALGDGFRTVPELCRILGVSQPTVSRMLRTEGESVIRVGRARATRYARAAKVFGGDTVVEIFRANAKGAVVLLGILRRLRDGRFLVQSEADERWLLGDAGDGLFPGLPYFLDDLRPSGYLGRTIARRLAASHGYPNDARMWNETQLGRWLLDFGEDAPGDLLLGAGACGRAQRYAGFVIDDRERDFPRFAAQSMLAGVPGSSAGGEQPKFTAFCPRAGHLIVKFSPAGASREAKRWRDLLRCEAAALALLRERGIPAAETELHEFDGRVYLESRRFDRRGASGRAAAISLAAVAAEFTGEIGGWTRSATDLVARGVMNEATREHIAWLELFGQWIGNTDMHGGNLSLRPSGAGFSLNPVYDMLPMAWAPVRGELPPVRFAAPARAQHEEIAWRASGEAACEFWEGAVHNTEHSDSFRRIAEGVLREVAELLAAGGER
ncbi:MAG: type II toxin-antitoxin system HipA family toxin YjjJ [Ignavibacteria bacterium]|nr:type II toxin-antitoxin system HipA family toxin YjjJ [Ignavibacteria bacterium]